MDLIKQFKHVIESNESDIFAFCQPITAEQAEQLKPQITKYLKRAEF